MPYNTPETFGDYLLPKIQHHDTLYSAVIAEVKKRATNLSRDNL
jgi:hypothetical protein